MTAETDAPVCVTAAFQAEVICWLPGKVQVRVQLVTAAPVLVRVSEAVNPPVHWLTWYATLHGPAAACTVAGATTTAAVSAQVPATPITASRSRCLPWAKRLMPASDPGMLGRSESNDRDFGGHRGGRPSAAAHPLTRQ